MKAEAVAPCARCLEPVTVTMELPLEETVGEDEVALDGTVLEIDPLVYGEVSVNLPIRFLCRDDCRGLCPTCGANWNISQCHCQDHKA